MSSVRVHAAVFYVLAASVAPGDNTTLTVAVGGILLTTALGVRHLVRREIRLGFRGQATVMAADSAVMLAVLANNRTDPHDTVFIAAALVVLEGGMRWARAGGLAVAAIMSVGVGLWTADVAPADAAVDELVVLRAGVLLVLGWGIGTIVWNLRTQNEAFRLALEASHDAMIAVDADGVVLTANAATRRLLWERIDDVIGRPLTEVLDRAGDVPALHDQQFVFERSDGTRCALHTTVSTISSLGVSYVVCRDVTVEHERRQRLLRDATTDTLTNLPNRRYLEEVLAEVTDDNRCGIALLFVDLDGFKPINDTYGHAAGDELLRQVAGRLTMVTRDGDLVARLAGDEFCLLLETGDRDAIDALIARLNASLREAFEVDGHVVHVSCSVGAAIRQPGESARNLMGRADAAMYDVKRRGGDDHSYGLRIVGS